MLLSRQSSQRNRSALGPFPAGHAVQVVLFSVTIRLSHSKHCTPKLENVRAPQSTQLVRSALGAVPGVHRVHVVCSLLTIFCPSHGWQVPWIEIFVPSHEIHTVRLRLGPLPGLQTVHVVCSSLTTLFSSHASHSLPRDENVCPWHCWHLDWSALGSVPESHLLQCSWFSSMTLGNAHV